MKRLLIGLFLLTALTANAYDSVEKLRVVDKGIFFDNTVDLSIEVFLSGKPSPTVILAHACGGDKAIGQTEWAERIRSWGYNVVKPDSFEPRGIDRDCGAQRMVPFEARARDFESVAQWASHQPWHTGGFVVVGFSHGAVGGLELANNVKSNLVKGVVAYYPKCWGWGQNKPTIPVQMHIANADDWTMAGPCISMAEDNDMFDGQVYPTATHVFDRHLPFAYYQGHKVGWDPIAAPIAEAKTHAFIDQYLKEKDYASKSN